jgi:hypothetical protein
MSALPLAAQVRRSEQTPVSGWDYTKAAEGMILVKADPGRGRHTATQARAKTEKIMDSYIVCLQGADAEPAFEVAFCDNDREAKDWAAALVTLLPGFSVSAIVPPSRSHLDS